MSALVDLEHATISGARAIRAVLRTLREFPAADVTHALEYTVVARATSGTGELLAPADLQIVLGVIAKAGAHARDTTQRIAEKLQSYYETHPVRVDVVEALTCAMQSIAAEGDDSADAATSVIGGAAASRVPVGAVRVEGAVRGGPLAKLSFDRT